MADDVRKIFAINLQRYMHEQGKTQADMARYFDVSTATSSDWYHGKKIPRADRLQAIADWLGIDLNDLLTDTVQKKGLPQYYNDPETRELVEFLHDNPDYKALFDAAKDVKPEDIEFVRQFIERMGGKND